MQHSGCRGPDAGDSGCTRSLLCWTKSIEPRRARLALKRVFASGSRMSNKEVVSDLLTRLPDDVSLQQIAREVEFVAGVREGLAQLDRGEGVEIDDVEKLIESWTTR